MDYAVFKDSNYPCINYTQVDFSKGCNVNCIYCGLTNNQKIERLSIEKLIQEKEIPNGLYFSPNSDPFSAVNCNSTHTILEKYLPLGVNALIITKKSIPDKTIKILSQFPKQVIVKVSLARLDEQLSNYIEEGADSPRIRLETINKLVSAGLNPQLLIMPIFPNIDDTVERIDSLIIQAAKIGVRYIKAAYVILRDTNKEKDQLILNKVKANEFLRESLEQMTEEMNLQIGYGKIFPIEKRLMAYNHIHKLCKKFDVNFSTCSILDPALRSLKNLDFLVCDNIHAIYNIK